MIHLARPQIQYVFPHTSRTDDDRNRLDTLRIREHKMERPIPLHHRDPSRTNYADDPFSAGPRCDCCWALKDFCYDGKIREV